MVDMEKGNLFVLLAKDEEDLERGEKERRKRDDRSNT